MNYGALIQAKCLQEILKKKYKLIFFDIKKIPYHLSEIFSLLKSFNFNFYKAFIFLKKIKKDYFNMTKYNKKNIISVEKLLYGSDEIWNYSRLALFKNYYLCGDTFGLKKNRISYAASFGEYKLKKNNNKLINYLKDFKAHSVRDFSSQKNLKNNKISSKLVLDPTLLLNLDFLIKNKLIKKRYILIYCDKLSDINIINIKNYAKKYNLKIFSAIYSYSWADKNFINISCSKFLRLFKDSNTIMTNMFHGTCFAINFRKKNIIFENPDKNNKLLSIKREFNLKINKKQSFSNYDINFFNKKLESKLFQKRNLSLKYLENVLIN